MTRSFAKVINSLLAISLYLDHGSTGYFDSPLPVVVNIA